MEDGSALFQEFAKEEASMAAAPLSSPVATAASAVSLPGAADGSVDAAEVGQLRKRLQDLEEIADSRENRISGVSDGNWFAVARQAFMSFAPSFPLQEKPGLQKSRPLFLLHSIHSFSWSERIVLSKLTTFDWRKQIRTRSPYLWMM